MKKQLMACALAAITAVSASAFDLKDLLGGTGDTVTNLIEGVLTTSNIEVKDLAGEWTVSGSAVSFQSENFLAKAGGVAGAAAIEAQLDPYFKKYGLTGGVFTFQTDGSFVFKVKSLSIKGVATKNADGNFTFTFQAFGKMNIGSMTTYIEKAPTSLNIMFDATKLKQLISMIAGFTGSSLAKTAGDLLTKYEGLCVGFKLSKTGSVEGEQSTGSSILNSILGGAKSSSSQSTTTEEETPATEQKSTESKASSILNLLKKK